MISILKQVGATHYISGPSAKNYIEDELFDEADIELEYINYDYPEYPHIHPQHDFQVSVIDLLFMTGKEASKYIWKNDAE